MKTSTSGETTKADEDEEIAYMDGSNEKGNDSSIIAE